VTLFDTAALDQPLADRLRPTCLAEVVGQQHLTDDGALLHSLVAQRSLPSMVLWGPPGVGKTTLAQVLANAAEASFEALSAVSAGVADLRAVLERAKDRRFAGRQTVLFLDEIHRFNKAQQDFLLPHVEAGRLTLIGATTENPGFSVIPALRSRCIMVALKGLEATDLDRLIDRGTAQLQPPKTLADGGRERLRRWCQGDGRRLLNMLEIAHRLADDCIDASHVGHAAGQTAVLHDRDGDGHYDTISALIKAMRGSDPDAALHYLARLLEGGEDEAFIARRLVIFAAEDVGNAAPQALVVAQAAADATRFIGMPEAQLPLAQAVTFLAGAPKSRAVTEGIAAARRDLQRGDWPRIPEHLLNRETPFPEPRSDGTGHLPSRFAGTVYYRPGEEAHD